MKSVHFSKLKDKRIREVVKLLESHNGFTSNQRINIELQLIKLGINEIGSGAYSTVYRCGKYVIKIGTDRFNKCRHWMTKPIFKKYTPKIHYIHKTGKAMICAYVKFRRFSWRKIDKLEKFLEELFDKHGIRVYDLHADNVVKVGEKIKIIDYGCFY
jgi:hypothetical protein